ncbi:uncharacterized protein LOC143280803 isoform X2 [Babylonia areolata]|uniref:uncharacterized protein LOC143280803 isoform X2 n=1 Tax=Babylonia areolata TaxID=304850 RepID=UPI003FD4139F
MGGRDQVHVGQGEWRAGVARPLSPPVDLCRTLPALLTHTTGLATHTPTQPHTRSPLLHPLASPFFTELLPRQCVGFTQAALCLASFVPSGFDEWSNESWGDFDDSLRLQREINNLRQEVSRLRTDSQHWRSVAGQLSQQSGNEVDQSAQHDLLNLQAKVKELERKAADSREQAQHEIASLQDVHQNKMASLKKRHKEEVTQLKSQLASLEQQLADSRDGDSSGTGGSSSVLPEAERPESEVEKTLRAQLASVTQDRDKARTAQAHLQEVLEELQGEVEALQRQRDDLQTSEDGRHAQEQDLQQQVQSLQAQLEEAERWRVEAEQGRQQVGVDLYHAKHCLLDQLEADHAETADLLSDVRCFRQQLSSETVHRQRRLLSEKQNMAMRLYAAGVQENQLKSSIVEAGTQLHQMSVDTENLIEQLGNPQAAQHTAVLLDSLERENLDLKEQCVKFEEQMILLEKRSASHQEEWQRSQATIRDLRQQLKQQQGGEHQGNNSSDDTLEQSFTTGTDHSPHSQTSHPAGEGVGMTPGWEVQEEALEQVLAQLRQEVQEKDEQISLLSTTGKEEEEVLLSLREENEQLQSELSSLREEKDELETSIGELDDQHQEATNHLIAARNALQAQLADSQQQVKALQDELKKLSQQQDSPPAAIDLSEQVGHLKQELEEAQQEVHTLRQQAASREGELADLKQKLQKGTLALNDLHMDKKDLEEEVAKAKDEVKAKVAAIKSMREEKAQLVEENKSLSERVEELEDEVDSWEQRNEESQAERSQLKQLQEQLSSQQVENWTQQQKLDSLFLELDESKALCRKLQQAGQAVDQEVGLRQALVEERDRAVEEKNKAVQEKGKAAANVAELEQQLAAVQEKHADSLQLLTSPAQRIGELEAQLSVLEDQLDLSAGEKRALQDEVLRLKEEILNQDGADTGDLKLCHQNIVRVLAKRSACLTRLKEDLESRSTLSGHIEDDSSHESADITGECLVELCRENRSLLDALVSGNTQLEEIQQQYYAEFTDSGTVLAHSSASNLQTSPSQVPDSVRKGVDLDSLQVENQRLLDVIRDKDSEILNLTHSVKDLQQENIVCRQSSGSLSESLSELEKVISDKDSELQILHTENGQLMKVCEESKSKITESDMKMTSLKTQLQETEAALRQAEEDLDTASGTMEKITEASALHSKQEEELVSARVKIQQLEKELSQATETLLSHKASIEELSIKYSDQRKTLEEEQARSSSQEGIIAHLRQAYATVDKELETLKLQLNNAMKFLSTEQREIIKEKFGDQTDSNVVAIENSHKPALQMKPSTGATVEQSKMLNGEVEVQGSDDSSELSAWHSHMLRQLQEKEETIADLQQNNAALLQMLEAKTLTSQSGDNTQLTVHQLQSEVKALKVEKEQMLAVMNEKSREASSLKAEVMRLMSVVSAEKSALDKLQKDNQELMSRSTPPRDDSLEDMTREAMQNLSRLVRDREVEIEALKQKNETLMAVLQDMNQSDGNTQGAGGVRTGASLASHIADKENLEKQVAALQGEREQMVTFLNQKHAESVAYHTEIQRLAALRAEEVVRFEQLQSDYDTLCPQFEDKKQSLLKVQNDLINYRQKYAELEVRYGELLQKSNASETVDAVSFNALQEEKERLASKHSELQQEVQSREEKLQAALERLKELENKLASKDTEVSALKKQVDSLQFQLQGLMMETADLKQENQAVEQRHTQWQEQGQALKDLNSQLTLSVREKELQVASLQERVQKLTALVSEQQGEKTQVAQLLREQEEASGLRAGLQQQVDQLTLALKQKQQQLNDIHAENLRLKEKEQKLSRELDRLRSHLLQIEEGYTREALEAEEREKVLRNRLAHAEEQLATTASHVQSASQQASQQVESLQQQLHSLASQRDAAYMQVASLQDQSQQYATSLSNLQLVLEQFQREKESQIASETERYLEDARKLKEQTARLERELQQAHEELEEATDGLAAASRLSEQLDRKEEALQALREEVQHRETALRDTEEEVRKLTSSKEAKVDRELMKNLLLGYFHTPDRNRMDAIHAIGSVLGFTQDDFHKIEESQGGGWVSNLFRRTRTPGTPSTPVHQSRPSSANQSFSQLFVKFLEVESTPPPAPVRLPAEEMAREVQQHHHHHPSRDKAPPFNPFTAPRHVSMPIPVGSAASAMASSSSSHLLMATPPGSPTTTFPVFAPFSTPAVSSSSSQSSSAILKDVLGSR